MVCWLRIAANAAIKAQKENRNCAKSPVPRSDRHNRILKESPRASPTARPEVASMPKGQSALRLLRHALIRARLVLWPGGLPFPVAQQPEKHERIAPILYPH